MLLPVYLLLSVILGKKNPFLYLLFPFALQQGPGAFINQSLSIGGKRIFSINEPIFGDLLFFIVISISVIWIGIKFPRLKYGGSILMLFYFIYLFTLTAVDFFTYGKPEEVLLTSRTLLYVPLAYFLWSSIYSAISRDQFENFLRVLFYITPVSALFYILNSSGIISIFPRELIYAEVEMEPSNSFRDFATIPLFLIPVLIISFQALLMPVLKINRFLIYLNLAILPIALLFTFTRSLLIMVILQLIIMTLFYCVSKGLRGVKQTFVFAFLFCILSVNIFFAAQKLFPQQLNYFTSRFSNVSTEGANEENVNIRLLYLDKATQLTNFTSPAFGVGMNREYYPELNNIGAWAADSTIPFFLYHTGWVGVAILYLILICFSIDSMVQYFRTGDWLVAYLASNFITLTIASLIMGGLELNGTVWTFMNLALYATIKLNLWRRTILIIPKSMKMAELQITNN